MAKAAVYRCPVCRDPEVVGRSCRSPGVSADFLKSVSGADLSGGRAGPGRTNRTSSDDPLVRQAVREALDGFEGAADLLKFFSDRSNAEDSEFTLSLLKGAANTKSPELAKAAVRRLSETPQDKGIVDLLRALIKRQGSK